MGSAKVRKALFSGFSLGTQMFHTAASCVQEDIVDKAALSAKST